MTQPLIPLPPRSHLLAGESGSASPGASGIGTGASPADVQRFEQAMQRGVEATAPAEPTARPANAPPPILGADSLGDAILGTLSRLSSVHHDAKDRVGQVLAAPDSELTARRMLEVQAALGEHSIVTQFVAGVSTQLTRLVDQTVKMQ